MASSREARSAAVLAVLAAAVACATPPPTFEEVPPAEDLYAKGERILEGRRLLGVVPLVDYTEAIETFQAIIDNYPYSDYAVLAELKIADSYFDDGKFEEALSYYRDFADLHPDHEKVPYTIYRSALSYERRVRSVGRDQTATESALEHLDRLLARYPYSEYGPEAETLWRDLRTRLARSVKEVADFYVNREEYESAAERYRSLLREYPGLGLDAEALYLLAFCYEQMNRLDEADRIYQAIVQNYRESEFAYRAEQKLSYTP